MRSIPLVVLVFTALALTACRRDEPASRIAPTPPADAAVAASATSSAPTPADASAPAASHADDLLRYTGASLAVSSNVDNPHDFPEHIVDGNPATAWNGRTGDLAGGWIAFRVPKGSHVSRIEMSAGFDKKNTDGDLFTMNHRIKRVRIKRAGVLVREHTFDMNARTPQAIPVDAAGGSYRIEIVETLPGSKSTWREACVSELRVIGTPAKNTTISKTAPTVGIGAFRAQAPNAVAATGNDAREPSDGEKAVSPLLGRVFPSLAAFCRAWDAVMNPLLARAEDAGWGSIPADHACRVVGPLGGGFAATAQIKSVTRVKVYQENWSEDRVAVETPAGFFIPEGSELESHSYNDPGCFGSTTHSVQVVRPTGGSVEIILGKAWKNTRYDYDEDGRLLGTVSTSDDVARINVACASSGPGMKCTHTDLERVCRIGPNVVACDSF